MSQAAAPARYRYSMYGVAVTSDFPFEFPLDDRTNAPAPLARMEFVEGSDGDFEMFSRTGASEAAVVCEPLPGGPTYLRWADWYEFSISADGTRVAWRAVDGCERAALQHFLFGQALALALVQQGIEPLHAAVVRLGDAAVGFLGDCAFGKSTLLATFLSAGDRVLTDDLLILDRRAGRAVALPGPGRIKLLPDSASQFLGDSEEGTPVSPLTTKRSFRVDAARRQPSGLPLRQLFILPDPDERDRIDAIEIRPASGVEVVHQLVKNTFTDGILTRERLARQFAHAAQIASEVDGFWLRYPSGLEHLGAIREAIIAHVDRSVLQPAS